jgi:Holliday junction DNA helicase RuvA
VVELKDKVLPEELTVQNTAVPAGPDSKESPITTQNLTNYQDAVSALLTLGYKATDADQAIRRASKSMDKNASTEELIRIALSK